MEKRTSFLPGKPWLDTDGKRIQAHGGSVFYENGTYYWYGENKAKTTPDSGVRSYGVEMYSSKDLYNWKDEGLILAPSDNPESPLHPSRILDRPHVLHCKKTGKYVMWMKFAGTYEKKDDWDVQYAGIATADKLTGPYTLQKTIAPQGQAKFGDFDLFIDDDGTAYVIYEKPHTELMIATLTDDFEDFEGTFTSHFHYKNPPFVREAPGIFKRNGKYYIISSGTTGYFPNPSEIGVSDSMHGDWTSLGDPCIGDMKRNSFHAQFSSVFRVHGTDIFIAMGDRWLTDLPEDMPDVMRVFEGWFDPEKESVMTAAELNSYTTFNTSLADYVWLPFRFETLPDGTEKPTLTFVPEWKIEDEI